MLLEELSYFLEVQVGQLRFHEGPFSDHYLILMALALLKEAFRDLEGGPVFWLLWKVVLLRDLNLSVAENISKEFTSATGVLSDKPELLLDLLGVFIEEQSGIKGSVGLLPHLADEKVSIKGVLSLLGGVRGKHSEHGVDSDKLVEMRAVQIHGLSVFFLSLG